MSVLRKKSKSDTTAEYTCSIRFLDDSESIQLTFKKDTLGQWLFDRVCEKLNLAEKDYFGLRYVDTDNQRHWLDPLKTAYKQLKGLNKMVLCFRVKFYPEDPMKLHEEMTRYFLFLQLRRDLHHGRLLCPHEESIQMAALIIQSEVGDYDSQDHPVGYVSSFKMLPKQTPRHEERIMEAHKALAGRVPSDCETNFLKKAASMETYGVDPHQVKDQKGDSLYLGVTHMGVMTFRGNRRTQLFKWTLIRRIAYEGKMFIINHSNSEDEDTSNSKKKQQAVGFKCNTAPAAKYLWRCAVEQQLFFTLSTSSAAPKIRSGGTLFSRGSKFRFSGRCQNEVYEASENIRRAEPAFARTSSLPNFTRKSHANENQNNTARNTLATASFKEDRRQFNVYLAKGKNKEEAAVDVPSIVTEGNVKSQNETILQGPKIQAPLAQVETFEEKLQQSSATEVSAPAPLPPLVVHKEEIPTSELPSPTSISNSWKENGQAVRDRPGILETSIDESPPYEPNQTLEESDVEEEKIEEKPCLEEQIQQLEEDIIQPSLQANVGLAPGKLQAPLPPLTKTADGKSCVGMCLKSILLSVMIMLLLSMIIFYVVFFSPVSHPFVNTLRDKLHILHPVRDFVEHTITDAVNFFKK